MATALQRPSTTVDSAAQSAETVSLAPSDVRGIAMAERLMIEQAPVVDLPVAIREVQVQSPKEVWQYLTGGGNYPFGENDPKPTWSQFVDFLRNTMCSLVNERLKEAESIIHSVREQEYTRNELLREANEYMQRELAGLRDRLSLLEAPADQGDPMDFEMTQLETITLPPNFRDGMMEAIKAEVLHLLSQDPGSGRRVAPFKLKQVQKAAPRRRDISRSGSPSLQGGRTLVPPV